MKTKEEIIEEIKLNAVDIIFNREAGWSDKLEKIIDFWITKALTQTREEAIMEVDEIIEQGKEYYSSEEMGDGYYILIDLQQSLKSLINK